MDKLTRTELEEIWQLCFEKEDAEMCFAIDKEYEERYGAVAFYSWIVRRLKINFS